MRAMHRRPHTGRAPQQQAASATPTSTAAQHALDESTHGPRQSWAKLPPCNPLRPKPQGAGRRNVCGRADALCPPGKTGPDCCRSRVLDKAHDALQEASGRARGVWLECGGLPKRRREQQADTWADARRQRNADQPARRRHTPLSWHARVRGTWRGASATGAARRAVRTQALASSRTIRACVRIPPDPKAAGPAADHGSQGRWPGSRQIPRPLARQQICPKAAGPAADHGSHPYHNS